MEMPADNSLVDKALWVWFALTALSVIHVAYDQFSKPQPMKVMRWSWTLATLYTGPVGWLLYRLSRRQSTAKSDRPEARSTSDETGETSDEPHWKHSLESTVHCLSGCVTGVLVAVVSASLLRLPMGVETVLEYIAAFVIGLFIFQALAAREMIGCSYGKAVRLSCLAQWLSMNVLMAGMVPVMVIVMSRDMSAAESSSLRFWGTLSLATLAGTALAYPVNWWLVSSGLQPAMDHMDHGRGHPPQSSTSTASRVAVSLATVAMLTAGVALAARFGDFSMRAGDMKNMPMKMSSARHNADQRSGSATQGMPRRMSPLRT